MRLTPSCGYPTVFFYPCSGDDFAEPLELFADAVTDMWFVDTAYFRPGHQDSRHSGMDRSAHEIPALLGDKRGWRLVERQVEGRPEWPARESGDMRNDSRFRRWAGSGDTRWEKLESPRIEPMPLEPCTLTETYQRAGGDHVVRIHRRRDHGVRFMLEHLPEIHVFFYRGDSMGEGGSGVRWTDIDSPLFREVEARLKPGGLLVADESNGGDRLLSVSLFGFSDYQEVATIGRRRGPTRAFRKIAG